MGSSENLRGEVQVWIAIQARNFSAGCRRLREPFHVSLNETPPRSVHDQASKASNSKSAGKRKGVIKVQREEGTPAKLEENNNTS